MIVSSLGLVPLIDHLYKSFRSKLDERKQLCNRIGAKYYETIKVVKSLRMLASTITMDNSSRIKEVNQLLYHFNALIIDIPNNGSTNDIDIEEVRKVFSDKAGDCILKLRDLFGELDNEGKDASVWDLVKAPDVAKKSTMILFEWENLMRIIARKRWMRTNKLKREYYEKAEGY